MGERVGSDVPYCVLGGTALAEGRGEVLDPAASAAPVLGGGVQARLPHLHPGAVCRRSTGCRLRCRPDTAGLLAALEAGDLAGVARRMYNVFEDVLPAAAARPGWQRSRTH